MFSDGGWFGGGAASLRIVAELKILQLWTDPPSVAPSQPGQSEVALDKACSSDGLIAPGNIAGDHMFRTYALSHTQLLVPPSGNAEFDLSCEITANARDGEAQVLFSGLSRQVMTPGIWVNFLS